MTQAKADQPHTAQLNKAEQKATAVTTIYPCPHCGEATVWQDNPHKPFCSKRCRLIDFGAWADEAYRLPADDSPFGTQLD